MKLVHFADTHLGMTNFGRLDTATGLNTRVLDYLDTLEAMVDAMRVLQPDIILFAGDAFRTRTPNPTLEMYYADIVQDMATIAPIIAVLGNHDRHTRGTGKRPSIELWDRLEAHNQITVADSIEHYDMCDIGTGPKVNVITMPWFYDKTLDEVLDDLDAALADIWNEDAPTILLGHCGVEGAELPAGGQYVYEVGRGKDFHIPLEVFADPELWDYVALGHVHKHQCMCDDPPVVYAGSTERIDWGERHCPAKGFVVVDIEDGHVSWSFVDLQVRRMLDLRVPLDNIECLGDMDVTDAILRVTVIVEAQQKEYSIQSLVTECLPDDYYCLDGVIVEYPEAMVDRRGEDAVQMSTLPPIKALEIFLDMQHPDDPEHVDDVLDCAYTLIHGEDDD